MFNNITPIDCYKNYWHRIFITFEILSRLLKTKKNLKCAHSGQNKKGKEFESRHNMSNCFHIHM
jgi:hypothetical protein